MQRRERKSWRGGEGPVCGTSGMSWQFVFLTFLFYSSPKLLHCSPFIISSPVTYTNKQCQSTKLSRLQVRSISGSFLDSESLKEALCVVLLAVCSR